MKCIKNCDIYNELILNSLTRCVTNRKQFSVSERRIIVKAKIEHDAEDSSDAQARIPQEHIDHCYDSLYAMDFGNNITSSFEVEVFVKSNTILKIEPTHTLRLFLPLDKRPQALQQDEKTKVSNGFLFDIMFIKFIPTRTKQSNLLHRAQVTVSLRLDDILLNR